MKNLAIIPARSGSKRIKNKNIRLFNGKPIIDWVINIAKKTDLFEEVIVSTDCKKIAQLSKELGASVPFLRPKDLSSDETPVIDVVRHAISQTRNEYSIDDNLSLIYATAPLLRTEYLKTSIEKLEFFDFAVSICSYPHPIQRALMIDENSKRLTMQNSREYFTRSQEFQEMFHDAGQFVSGKIKAWENAVPFVNEATTGIHIPRYLVQDIDTEEDWKEAEIKFNLLKNT